MSIISFLSGEKINIKLLIKVGDTAVSAAQDRGHDALALQIARYISKKIARYISKKIASTFPAKNFQQSLGYSTYSCQQQEPLAMRL